MANEIRPLYGTVTALTMLLTAITDAQGRISALVDNSTDRFGKVTIYARIRNGASATTDGAVYKFYLVRHDGHATEYITDGLGQSDADVTPEPPNAQHIGSIVVGTGANTFYYGDFVFENPGPEWSIVFWNASGAVNHATEADSFVHFRGENPEVAD